MTQPDLQVSIEATSKAYDRADEAFLEQVYALYHSLQSAGINLIDREDPGTKSGLLISSAIQAIVAGGAGLTSLCGVLKIWIKQRGDRIIRLTVHGPDDIQHTIVLDGQNVSDQALTEFAKAASKHLQ